MAETQMFDAAGFIAANRAIDTDVCVKAGGNVVPFKGKVAGVAAAE